jgi:hypothetical protein
MPKVEPDEQGRLVLSEEFLQRRHIPPSTEYWLDEREGDLILHQCIEVRGFHFPSCPDCDLRKDAISEDVMRDAGDGILPVPIVFGRRIS